jgi:putative BNR repeat neuraminidase
LLICVAAVSPLGLYGVQPRTVIVFNDDGGWCWFQGERALVSGGTLLIGSVAAGVRDPARRGNIEVVTYDLSSGRKRLSVLHPRLSDGPESQYDDHNAPAFLVRPDGRILAVYSKHGPENQFYYRISAEPRNPATWLERFRFKYLHIHRRRSNLFIRLRRPY